MSRKIFIGNIPPIKYIYSKICMINAHNIKFLFGFDFNNWKFFFIEKTIN